MKYTLIKLFKDIVDDNLNIVNIKSVFSSINHYMRFVDSIKKQLDVRYFGEYLAILRDDGLVAIVGVDETKNLFCQILPTKFDRKLFSILSNKAIRKFMGFDKHLHEVKYLREGIKLRFQGDLLIEFIRLYDNTRQLLRFIRQYLMQALFLLPISFINELLEKRLIANLSQFKLLFDKEDSLIEYIINELKSIERSQRNRIKINEILFVSTLLPTIFTIHSDIDDIVLLDDLEAYLLSLKKSFHNFMRSIANLEKQFSINVGSHQVKLAGIHVADINTRISFFNTNIFRSTSLPGNEFQTFIILRDQEISAHHPEHVDAKLSVRPCIIKLSILRSLDKVKSYSLALDNSVLQNSIFFAMDILSRISRLEQTLTPPYLLNTLISGAIQIGLHDKISQEKIKKVIIPIGKAEVELMMIRILGNRGTPATYFIVYQKEKIF